MNRRIQNGLASALAAALALYGSQSFASSHREAPGITKMPKVDGTDFYMFNSYEAGRSGYVTLIANYQGLQDPGGGPNYFTMDPDAIYDIHIDNVGDANAHLTYEFKFTNALTGITLPVGGNNVAIPLRVGGPVSGASSPNINENESYTLTLITGDPRTGTRAAVTNASGGSSTFVKPLDNVGNKTIPNYPAYAGQYIYNITIPGCSTPGRVFVGQRADAFAANLGEIFDLVDFVPIEGDTDPVYNNPANTAGAAFPGGIVQDHANDDIVGKKNVTSLALEIPTSCLVGASSNTVIGGWTTASLPQARLLNPAATYPVPSISGGAYVQVSRLANPLVNELVIGLPMKDTFNSSSPSGDSQFLTYVADPAFPALLNALFLAPVNATLGANLTNLAPSNLPRTDLEAVFLTGIATVNQLPTVTPSEEMRLNTAIPAVAQASQSPLGVLGNDQAGYPNGRRPGDDAIDITLRVAMGALCYNIPIGTKSVNLGFCTPAQAPVGNVAFTDGAPMNATHLLATFPYLNAPIPGGPHTANAPGGYGEAASGAGEAQ